MLVAYWHVVGSGVCGHCGRGLHKEILASSCGHGLVVILLFEQMGEKQFKFLIGILTLGRDGFS